MAFGPGEGTLGFGPGGGTLGPGTLVPHFGIASKDGFADIQWLVTVVGIWSICSLSSGSVARFEAPGEVSLCIFFLMASITAIDPTTDVLNSVK